MTVNKEMQKQLWTKGIVALSTLVLVIAVVIAATTAWFTKMTNVAGMEFSIAQWDFKANYQMDDFFVNVYEYYSLTENRAAPGTAGEIPIKLTASGSDTDVKYVIRVDRSGMEPEFQKRIFFYYMAGETRKYFTDVNVLEGTLGRESSEVVTLYWEWVYELEYGRTKTHQPGDRIEFLPAEGDTGYSDQDLVSVSYNVHESNEFDTRVGLNPGQYASQIIATVKIFGYQVEPERVVD